MKTFSKEADTTTEASFIISWNIFRFKHPYSDGEFITKNISEVVAVLDPKNTKLQRLISQTPVSKHTVERWVSRINVDVKDKLQNDLKNSTAFSLALDELTDVRDSPQLAVFVHYVSNDVAVKEELLDLIALKETTRGVDINNALDILVNAEVLPNRLVSVATDRAPAMIGGYAGFTLSRSTKQNSSCTNANDVYSHPFLSLHKKFTKKTICDFISHPIFIKFSKDHA